MIRRLLLPFVRERLGHVLGSDSTVTIVSAEERGVDLAWSSPRREPLAFGGRRAERIGLDPRRRLPDRDFDDNAWPRDAAP